MGCLWIETCIVGVSLEFIVAPLVTNHDVEVLRLREILVVLCVGREGEVVLLLVRIAAVAIVKVCRTPRCIVCVLSTIGPVTAGIGMQAEILETMNLIVNFHITHVVV